MIDKKIKPTVQGGVDNYLGKQPQVQAPRKWQSAPDKPATELAYITEAEKDLILKANIHGGLEGGPNMGPSGIMSLDSFGDVGGAGASGGDTSAGGGANEGAGFSGQGPGQSDRDFDRQKANQRAALQIAERKQARDLSKLTGRNIYERKNIANRTYGPLQKYTGERGFLGNLFRGANKYGYTDTYTSGPKAGQVKPGFGGRILGGLGSLLTGIPFVGGAIGTAYDYGKGIFAPKKRDMSEFNRLGLFGVKPGTYDFDLNAKINQNVDTTGYSRFGDIGKPKKLDLSKLKMGDLNNIPSLISAAETPKAQAPDFMWASPQFKEGLDNSMYGGDRMLFGAGVDDQLYYDGDVFPGGEVYESDADGITNYSFDTQPQEDGIMSIDVEYPSNDLIAGLTKKQQQMLSGPQKNLKNIMGISDQEILNNISPFNNPNDPATLEEVTNFYTT